MGEVLIRFLTDEPSSGNRTSLESRLSRTSSAALPIFQQNSQTRMCAKQSSALSIRATYDSDASQLVFELRGTSRTSHPDLKSAHL